MAKNFFNPYVALIVIEDPDPEVGPGSGDSTDEPFPCDWEDWFNMFEDDYYEDGITDEKDYCQWWLNQGYTWAQWLEFNSEDDWKLDTFPTGH